MITPRVPRGDVLTWLFDVTAEEYKHPGPALRDASPIHRVAPKSPPVFIVHDGPADLSGPRDPRVTGANMRLHSPAFGLALAARLRKAGVAHEVLIAPDASRTFQQKALAFLKRYL